MAVLKHTSPTAEPMAPSPCPAMTVPSASTSRPVRGVSVHGFGGSAAIYRHPRAGGDPRKSPLWHHDLAWMPDFVLEARLRHDTTRRGHDSGLGRRTEPRGQLGLVVCIEWP